MIKKSLVKVATKAAPIKKPTGLTKLISTNSNDAWSARQDMHTLKDAESIKADPLRHSAAVHHAKSEVMSLQKVARKKV